MRYLAPVDPAPIRWWAEAVTALDATSAADSIHCDILDHALRCEVDSDDPEQTTAALAALEGTAIGPWLDAAGADEGEEKGFSLTLGSQTWTDPTAIE